MFKFNQTFLDRNAIVRDDPEQIERLASDPRVKLILFNERFQVLMSPDGIHTANAAHDSQAPQSSEWLYLGQSQPYVTTSGGTDITNTDSIHSESSIHKSNNAPWFCAIINSHSFELQHHRQWSDLRLTMSAIAEPEASAVAFAKALLYWHKKHQYCGKCGEKTIIQSSGHERQCTACQQVVYPRTDPAIIISVTHKGRLLLARQASWPPARYSVLAGFVEPGESFEQAAEREVLEESGITIHSPEYIASQPWPFPCSIMIGFTAEAKNDAINLDDDELEHAFWVEPEELISKLAAGELKLPTYGSISHYLIDRWADQHGVSISRWDHP